MHKHSTSRPTYLATKKTGAPKYGRYGAATSAAMVVHIAKSHLDDSIAALRGEIAALRARVEELESQRGRIVALGTLGIPGYAIVRDPSVAIVTSGDGFIAESMDLEIYATGDDELSALDNFRHTLVDEFAFLDTHRDELGPGPASQLARLSEVVRRLP